MRTIRLLLLGVGRSAVWPAYLALAAYAARQAPWPKTLAQPVATALAFVAVAVFVANLVRRLFRPRGRAEDVFGMTPEVCRQVRRALLTLMAAHVVFLVPVFLLTQGLVAPAGRPTSAPAVVRWLTLGFEATVLLVACWNLRRRSALALWLAESPARLGPAAGHQRKATAATVLGIVVVIVLDARGYSFAAHRLASGAAGSLIAAAVCWGVYRVLLRFINNHAWRWIRVGKALSKRGDLEASAMPDDLAARLRHLSALLASGLGLLMTSWVWGLDLALFRFIGGQELWATGSFVMDGTARVPVFVTVGDLTRAVAVAALCATAWRYMSTFFAVVVFPRMPDDPGVRFAVVTLCRYAVVGVGLLCVLSAVHLGLEKIGMVLAALGVGLGFGLQEIVSNFVCGIILLLERPIRVGDVVTVSGQTGKVDRINIRATTITNGDNQSMIIPNRAFITGDLVNWTLKDKIIRVTVRVKVAYGTDPDRVSELLLAIARDDADVLRNPVPTALMEEMSDSALVFVLHAHVPEPGLAGRVKHRLFRQIQQRFKEANFEIPLPAQELLLKPIDGLSPFAQRGPHFRADPPSPSPHGLRSNPIRPALEPVEDGHRGVDE